MYRILCLITCVVILSGCRAPMPSIRSSQLMSAFGSTRVPPPPTQSIVTASQYNATAAPTTAAAPASGGWRTATSTSGTTNTGQTNTGDARLVPQASSSSQSNKFAQQSNDTAVQPASYVTTSGTSGQQRTIGSGASEVQLNGMHVNDATSSSSGTVGVPSSTTQMPTSGSASTSSSVSSPTTTTGTSSDSLNWRTRGT